jgi:anaphase-promoting complex subunit 10
LAERWSATSYDNDRIPEVYGDLVPVALSRLQSRRVLYAAKVSIHLSYKQWMTLCRVQVYTGQSILDLDDPPVVMNFNEPVGWQVLDLRRANQNSVSAFIVQVQILHNHQNGRDTHVRACKVLGPRTNDENVAFRRDDLIGALKRDDILLDYCIR